MNKIVKRMTFSAMIAAIYFGCCFLEQSFASGAIQCRLSEGFTLLALFFPEAIAGVTIGCLIYNLCFGAGIYDIVFGTLATLLAGICTYFIGKFVKKDWLRILLGGLPPVLFNAFIIPGVLLASGVEGSYWFFVLTVGAGEAIAVYVAGGLLYFPLKAMFEKYHMIEEE